MDSIILRILVLFLANGYRGEFLVVEKTGLTIGESFLNLPATVGLARVMAKFSLIFSIFCIFATYYFLLAFSSLFKFSFVKYLGNSIVFYILGEFLNIVEIGRENSDNYCTSFPLSTSLSKSE